MTTDTLHHTISGMDESAARTTIGGLQTSGEATEAGVARAAHG